MSKKMSNAPVYYALAQAKFNPVAAMGNKYIKDVQDAFRLMGYTLFEPQERKQLQFSANLGQLPAEPKIETKLFWLITEMNRKSGFILDQSSLVFHTTHYETNEKFIPELLEGLEAVHQIVRLEHVSRLGLRYLNAVIPGNKEHVEQYLSSGLHGIKFGSHPKYSLYESVFETSKNPKSTLIARIHCSTDVLGYPPDMAPNGLLPMERFNRNEKITHAVIDTDHYLEDRMKIDFKQLKSQLKTLHTGIKHVFAAISTEHATNIWKK
ncbi:TIGR04255 family protein [Nitrosomonas sp. Nm51]|uniref:TIGR04255 family protein n=1 Tax=Nitrosomonas sp. Nm51 TaxID=133720 RepID=UPI0008D34727|nr:TIGR04255 family protein [Nitrosomonas sp. Nm51]SER46205.1 TIGR04255 family protein [Nitrosomonas sp. Nm51]